jgi:hypothetical protein
MSVDTKSHAKILQQTHSLRANNDKIMHEILHRIIHRERSTAFNSIASRSKSAKSEKHSTLFRQLEYAISVYFFFGKTSEKTC